MVNSFTVLGKADRDMTILVGFECSVDIRFVVYC